MKQPWFITYQKLLVWLVNTSFGRWYFKLENFPYKIVRVSAWGVLGHIKSQKYCARFAIYPFIERKLFPLYLLHLWDMFLANRFIPAWNLGLDTFGVGTGGGDCLDTTTAESWADKRGQASSDAVRDTSNSGLDRLHAVKDGSDFSLSRVSLITDTSALMDGATVASATWTVESTANTIVDTYRCVLVPNTQADNNTLATGDFDQFGTTDSPTEYASRVDVTGASQTIAIPLNATGKAAISLTTLTKMGVRSNMDVDNSAPTGQNTIRIDWTSNKTFLTVLLTASSGLQSKYW